MAEDLDKFCDLAPLIRGVSGRDRVLDRMLDMVAENGTLDLLERGLYRLDLVDHIDAIAVIGDHPRDPAHLAFDAAQPDGGGLLDGFSHGPQSIPV